MIERYTKAKNGLWDSAVRESRNGTFLHMRGYMDYHSDRFNDFSLLAFDSKNRLIAVMPANAEGTTLCSHRGLTYGGWLMTPRADTNAMLALWQEFTEFAKSAGFKSLLYKPVPHIFHKYPAEEDLYALWHSGGVLEAVQSSSVTDLASPLPFDNNSRRALKRAADAGIVCRECSDWATFWGILGIVLNERHNTSPVHSLAEICLLHERFPHNIKLFAAYRGTEMLAGTVLYITETTAHAQYIASSDAGRECGALACIFDNLYRLMATKVRWFDFGISNEDGGRVLNHGLTRQKSGFGARCITFNSYRLNL